MLARGGDELLQGIASIDGGRCHPAAIYFSALSERLSGEPMVQGEPGCGLVLFLADLFAVSFACKSFLDATLLTWLQIEGVTLDLFDDVFGLHLAFEATQCIFERFTFLNTNLCQWKNTSKPPMRGHHLGYREEVPKGRGG